MRQDVLVMENLFYDRKIDKVFDTLNMATPQLNGTGGWEVRCGRYAGLMISRLNSGSSGADFSPAKERSAMSPVLTGTCKSNIWGYLCDEPASLPGGSKNTLSL